MENDLKLNVQPYIDAKTVHRSTATNKNNCTS